ncbi:MAG: hypothetical protein DMG65_17360 [Candidatus Angelobacter sp. Gp1-AA117]|nr:MAG: hypothetical protein DMG65_17360 [Candidatus Angelobacter sp. Gp1-AA117]
MNRRLSKQEAQKLLRYCAENGVVEPHPHFLSALRDDGLDLLDAMPVLKSGIVYDEPEFDVRFRQWRYKVEGKESGGRWLMIVFTFRADDETLLITAYLKAAGGRRG